MVEELPRLPVEQVHQLLPPDKQITDKVDCFVYALYLLGGKATDCEVQLAIYVLHRLGICRIESDWRYKPCAWWPDCCKKCNQKEQTEVNE